MFFHLSSSTPTNSAIRNQFFLSGSRNTTWLLQNLVPWYSHVTAHSLCSQSRACLRPFPIRFKELVFRSLTAKIPKALASRLPGFLSGCLTYHIAFCDVKRLFALGVSHLRCGCGCTLTGGHCHRFECGWNIAHFRRLCQQTTATEIRILPCPIFPVPVLFP